MNLNVITNNIQMNGFHNCVVMALPVRFICLLWLILIIIQGFSRTLK